MADKLFQSIFLTHFVFFFFLALLRLKGCKGKFLFNFLLCKNKCIVRTPFSQVLFPHKIQCYKLKLEDVGPVKLKIVTNSFFSKMEPGYFIIDSVYLYIK